MSQAISFAKSQDDADLWEDLLNYSMDKPRFIRGLLEEVGTAIDPIRLVRRIPEGLEIEGLREGLSRMIKEYEIQESISEGVARVLRGEVAMAQNALRAGQRRGVKFDVIEEKEIVEPLTEKSGKSHKSTKPGYCLGCKLAFTELETETLVGFACGHVFHLSHLLNFKRGDDERPLTPPNERGLDWNGEGDGSDGEYTQNVHSIGAKVTHARLLRDKITEGCPVCHDHDVGEGGNHL